MECLLKTKTHEAIIFLHSQEGIEPAPPVTVFAHKELAITVDHVSIIQEFPLFLVNYLQNRKLKKTKFCERIAG